MRSRFYGFLLICLVPLTFMVSCRDKAVEEFSKQERDLFVLRGQFSIPDKDKEGVGKQIKAYRQRNPNLSSAALYQYYTGMFEYHSKSSFNYREALYNIDSAINEISPVFNNYKDLAEAYFSKADVLVELGKYDEAFNTYFQSKQYIDKINDACISNKYSYRIAMVLYKQKKFDDAIFFFKRGLAEITNCGNHDYTSSIRIQEYHNNIALSFTKLNKLDSAVLWYRKGLNYIDTRKIVDSTVIYFQKARGVIYGNLGGALIKKGEKAEGEKMLLESVKINDKPRFEVRDAMTAKFKLIDHYLRENRINNAKLLIAQVDTSSVLTNIEHKLIFLNLKARYYDIVGNVNDAFISLKNANEIRDSVQRQLDGIKAINLSERLDYLDVEERVEGLEQERNAQRRLLLLISVFVVVSLGLLVMIYFYWNRSRKSLKKLELLNLKMADQNNVLERTLQELELSNREKDSILRAVAHDLRNPIAGISIMVDLLSRDVTDEKEKYKFDLLKRANHSALTLINDLMEAATGNQKDETEAEKKEVNYITFVEGTVDFLSFKAKEKEQNLSFKTNLKTKLVQISEEKLTRVISNLITNAIKFSPAQTAIVVEVSVEGKALLTKVKDQGIGISEDLKKEVFIAFTKAKRFGTNGEKSHGLGLSISKQIVENHGGEIWVEDNPAGGSVFCFTLPL